MLLSLFLLSIAAVLALPLLAPVLAVARAAVLALALLLAPVLAVARAAVLALALGAPVLAVACAAVLAGALPAPVLALGLARSPALAAAKTVVLFAAVLVGANFARKGCGPLSRLCDPEFNCLLYVVYWLMSIACCLLPIV
jgi:hypothetical protein